MTLSDTLTLKDIAHRLHMGESTVNVWRNRYRQWMPETLPGDPDRYPPNILDLFRLIARCTNAGFENAEIERILESMHGERKDSTRDHGENGDENRDGRENKQNGAKDGHIGEVLVTLKDLMAGMVSQQERIAEAQERRAAAQERMAYAMESQAENELVKTEVMRELVTAIQDFQVTGAVSSMMEHVKNIAAPSKTELADFSTDMGFDMDNLEELSEYRVETKEGGAVHDFDETAGAFHDPYESADDNMGFPDLDIMPHLSKAEDTEIMGMDDLSLLLEPEDAPMSAADMDDLSALLEPEDRTMAVEDMDDLSLLLDDADKTPVDMDDLSRLIDDEPQGATKPIAAETREPEKEANEKKPASSVDENYKSQILKRIIQMKQKEGLSVEETARRFNDEGVKTLSGKETWDVRTIQGIYKYIDSFS